MTKIISFDIGIKNMAFCLFDLSSSQIFVEKWQILNLMNEEAPKRTCTCTLQPKNKKSLVKICSKLAKWSKSENFYCEKHAKMHDKFILPSKECSPVAIKKMDAPALKLLCQNHHISPEKDTKKAMIDALMNYYAKTCFEPITVKKKSAGDADLITIGKNLKKLLDEIENMETVDIVLIENQISPIANRMKTIQGMLAQYFIMKNTDVRIEFLSSANKLKNFAPLENTLRTETEENTYKMNKKNGVEYCSRILNQNANFENWKYVLETKKKDDLADAFLQGIWFIQNKINTMRMT